jgi:1,2-phenylacetyl-CoA epoxidase catalytic subunit
VLIAKQARVLKGVGMSGKLAKIGTFSDWVGLFDDWRKDIGVNRGAIAEFKFDTLFGAIETDEIQFGSYKGRRKWENLRQVPTQQMRDALINLIVYQGDTEFASVEQQRNLFESAPSDWDRKAITRVMIEEMRHGWQMCALLVEHFGYSGKVEAQKMLERRAFENKRLLGAFNVEVDNWMDFFTYTDFVDRDGKFQLQMLKYSAFAPLGRSMSYMLREEAFHMGTGNDGLRRIVQAGVVPPWLIQKYLNKWISSSYDLFGTDHSSSAHWAYVWGIKGRYDEPKNDQTAKLDELNDYNRHLYRDEVAGLVERLNSALARTSSTPLTSGLTGPSDGGQDRSSTPEPASHSTIALTRSTSKTTCLRRKIRSCCWILSTTKRNGSRPRKVLAIPCPPLASRANRQSICSLASKLT